MQLFRRVCVVVDVDDDTCALREAGERAWKLAVVRGGGNDVVRGEFHEAAEFQQTVSIKRHPYSPGLRAPT